MEQNREPKNRLTKKQKKYKAAKIVFQQMVLVKLGIHMCLCVFQRWECTASLTYQETSVSLQELQSLMAHGTYETNDCNILWWTQMKFLANSIKHKTLVSSYIPGPSICILSRPVTSPSTDRPPSKPTSQSQSGLPLCSPLKTSLPEGLSAPSFPSASKHT